MTDPGANTFQGIPRSSRACRPAARPSHGLWLFCALSLWVFFAPHRALAAEDEADRAPASRAASSEESESPPGTDSPSDVDRDRDRPRPHADDPGIHVAIRDMLAEARTGKVRKEPVSPSEAHLRLFYRGFDFHCATGPCWYNGAGLVVYPSAWLDLRGGWQALRFGIGLAGGGESSQTRDRWWQHDFVLEALLVVGLKYPWRLTPYAEFLVGLGAMHRNLYNKDQVFFAYSFGLEAGLELFIRGSFHIGASVGWRRSLVKTDLHVLYADSVTCSVFFGF